jgi:rSAM/selenodomain-associated transferase 2
VVRAAVTRPLLSVVIPALDEAGSIGGLLDDLRGLGVSHEVIVVDGGSHDDTAEIARRAGATVVMSRRGRGHQLRAGGNVAAGAALCFLHADVRLSPGTLDAIADVASSGAVRAVAFRRAIAAPGWRYRVVECGALLRAHVLRMPYGDQGIVMTREIYDAVGGVADVPLMEDVLLACALRAAGGVTIRSERVVVSARRWERDGVFRRSAANLALLFRFLAGASPASLAKRYRGPA